MENNIYGFIYKILNSINDKVYIGQTTKTVEERFKGHIASAKKIKKESKKNYCAIHLAMQKFGIENFSVSTIDTASSREELNEKEIYWISHYNSICPFGYNIAAGGEINPMFNPIQKERHDKKMRSKAIRDKISKTLSEKRLRDGFSTEHLQKIKESRQRRKEERAALGLNFYNNPEHFATRSIPVYCILDTKERFEFSSIIEAGRWWFDNYKPFGETYSSATYQRKIEASLNNQEIECRVKIDSHYVKKIITNIKWYLQEKEGDISDNQNKN